MPSPTHYALLGLPASASAAQIRAAYRLTIRATHPDHSSNETDRRRRTERAAALNAAYAVLRDPAARFEYDRSLETPASPPQAGTYRASAPAPAVTPTATIPPDRFERLISWIVSHALGQYVALVLIIAIAAISAPLFAVPGHETGHIGSIVVAWLAIGALLGGRRSPAGDLAALAGMLLSPIVGSMNTSHAR